MEFAEGFQECAAREVAEETGVIRDPEEFKYVTTVNVIRKELDYHYVTIILSIKLSRDTEIVNMEPDKNAGWNWISWDEAKTKPNLFYSISELINSGYTELTHFM